MNTHARARRGGWARYGVSVAVVAVATAVNIALWRWIQPHFSPLFFAAIMIAGWFGGLGPGLLATALAAVVCAIFFLGPGYSLQLSREDVSLLCVFLAVATLISWLNERRKIAELGLERARLGLEEKVAQRTADLERINRELRAHQEQLRELSAQLARTEQEERRRIAAALHDGLGQLLAIAEIKLEAVLERPSGPTASETELRDAAAEARALLDDALDQTRSLTMNLSPPALYELGLKAALDWLAQEMEQRYHLQVDVVAPPATKPFPLDLDDATRSVLYHAIRELVINVAKHAGVSRARVTLSQSHTPPPPRVDVTVEDNGVGFDPATVLADASTEAHGSQDGRRRGFGLLNIRERIGHLGGSLQITATPGRAGTRVQLTVPIRTDTPMPAPPATAPTVEVHPASP